jgi:hypothetical protein
MMDAMGARGDVMVNDNAQRPLDSEWPAEQIAALNDAVQGRTVEALEVGQANDHQYVLITFTDGLQLRVECERLKMVDPIEPQHI